MDLIFSIKEKVQELINKNAEMEERIKSLENILANIVTSN